MILDDAKDGLETGGSEDCRIASGNITQCDDSGEIAKLNCARIPEII